MSLETAEQMDVSNLVISAVSAVATVAAAVAAWRAANQARKTAEATQSMIQGSILATLLADFGSKETTEGLRTLFGFVNKHGKNKAIELFNQKRADDGDWEKIDAARRHLDSYYKRCWMLYRGKYIRGVDFDSIRDTYGYTLFVSVVAQFDPHAPLSGPRSKDWAEAMAEEFPAKRIPRGGIRE